ncbi:hypothetical protein H5410_015457 [Solanum commersonii]|uniref:Uncharacterized protein n=1 Tax=Solanum commersonii TaxID=4109 RepID=A0A9J5ZTT6_SOLCO|nr:hypothetical protein H5410_015457 [Solanum commersonii]
MDSKRKQGVPDGFLVLDEEIGSSVAYLPLGTQQLQQPAKVRTTIFHLVHSCIEALSMKNKVVADSTKLKYLGCAAVTWFQVLSGSPNKDKMERNLVIQRPIEEQVFWKEVIADNYKGLVEHIIQGRRCGKDKVFGTLVALETANHMPCQKENTVQSMSQRLQDGKVFRNSSFRRKFQNWRLNELQSLIKMQNLDLSVWFPKVPGGFLCLARKSTTEDMLPRLVCYKNVILTARPQQSLQVRVIMEVLSRPSKSIEQGDFEVYQLGNGALKVLFPDIFLLKLGWELKLRRGLYDWEMNRMTELYKVQTISKASQDYTMEMTH